jgi:hypothetical protein
MPVAHDAGSSAARLSLRGPLHHRPGPSIAQLSLTGLEATAVVPVAGPPTLPRAILPVTILAPVSPALRRPPLLQGRCAAQAGHRPPALATLTAAEVIFFCFYKLYFECE